ncbi:altered inheritance of mitochondria protein 21 [Xylariaceae sp. FL0016]|nr:altered inheritance of mitochondria protein 21 [Xylariaceae sp. FL0016]
MSAATMQSTPAIPPRPSRSQDKGTGSSAPMIPPRPTKRFNRSVSPNPDRFAPSPLNESPFVPKSPRHSQSHLGESIERSKSVDMPGVGQEGQEYAAAIEDMQDTMPEPVSPGSAGSAEQTRTVGDDLKLHAPKPTMPASSAKQRVQQVTRTDSDRAAAFGIGRPSSDDPVQSANRSLKKKASTTSQLSHHSEMAGEDDHGIPEIGQRVPMLANAGDVQAPSPAPPRAPSAEGHRPGRAHTRKLSARGGFNELPPGSYGLHGHGVQSSDKLEKAYYEKHPELKSKEHYNHLHDRVHDYAMSSEDLNKIVRDTASRGAGFGTTEHVGTPSEQVGFQASEEYARKSSRPPSAAAKRNSVTSPLKAGFEHEFVIDDTHAQDDDGDDGDDDVIHVDEYGQRKGFAKFGDEESAEGHGASEDTFHPVLASDEVAKHTPTYELQPAVPPPRERHGSSYEMEQPRSRPSSRPTSIYSPPPPEIRSTPLDDVEEYAPLFPEDEKNADQEKLQAQKLKEHRHRFPSRDIWEDAPNSVHTTAEVNTPEPTDRPKSSSFVVDVPPREGETPAQAFARRQEELAEKEAINPDAFLHRQQKPPSWAEHKAHLSPEMHARPNMAQRFPSRDVWEDTPDSLQFTTTVSTPQTTADSPTEDTTKAKPFVPARPPRKSGSGDDKPVVPDRPKPQIPARPSKPASESKGPEPSAKAKPAVPARPAGGKIAALQAGFMSDLNNRLRLGPQAPKKEDPPAEETQEKEKAPLSDARKGRARGPQRRAPTKSKSPSPTTQSTPPPASNGLPVLSFSMTRTLWSIDEEGTMTVDNFGSDDKRASEPKVEEVTSEEPAEEAEPAVQLPTEETESTPAEHEAPESHDTDAAEETKTLATNMAGESVVEETIEKKERGDEVEGVKDASENVTA